MGFESNTKPATPTNAILGNHLATFLALLSMMRVSLALVMRANRLFTSSKCMLGAGKGNRTPVFSLESCHNTIILYPQIDHEIGGQICFRRSLKYRAYNKSFLKNFQPDRPVRLMRDNIEFCENFRLHQIITFVRHIDRNILISILTQ